MRPLLALLPLLLLAACEPGARAAVLPVDSMRPAAAALAEFRHDVPEVHALAGGAPSRDALIHAFVGALEQGDTAAVRGLLVDRAEFAWLVYPTSAQAAPPYELPPDVLWNTLDPQSRAGIQHLFRAAAGRDHGFLDYACPAEPVVEGANRIWGPCTMRFQGDAGPYRVRLTGPILERDGVFKFVSYTNELD